GIRLALLNNRNLEFILLIISDVDLPFYYMMQRMRLTQLMTNLATDGSLPRFGVFTLWGYDDSTTPPTIIRNYVHSKAAIADDQWATVGSANLDGVSLMTGEYLAPSVFIPGMENRRSTEVNAVIFDRIDVLPT